MADAVLSAAGPGVPPLTGRDGQIETLEGALMRAAAGSAAMVVVEGEPGIGKTRLLQEAASRAAAQDLVVASGTATEFERELPFGLVIDALDELLAGAPDRLRVLDRHQRDRLAALFPSLAGQRAARRESMPDERHGTLRAIRAAIEVLARERPLALLLDDVHWADPASLELLAQLARRPLPRVAILVATRLEQPSSELRAALHAADRAGTLERVGLGPLTLAEAERMLAALRPESPGPGPGESRAIYEDSGGNPFYLEQLARAVTRRPSGRRVRDPDAPQLPGVPEAVRLSLARELEALSPRGRLAAQAAAVAGDPFPACLAAAIMEEEEGAALQALGELIERDLVRAEPAGALFRFRHPVVRRAIYDGVSPAWRVSAHARAAVSLEERGAPIAVRAHHEERSAQPGDERAVAVLGEAGAACSRWPRSRLPVTCGPRWSCFRRATRATCAAWGCSSR